MKHEEIRRIIKKRFEKLDFAFDNVRLHYSEDSIRVFRVKVKKLQACLNLIHSEKGDGQPIALPTKINKLYDAAGAIRSLQIQQQYIHKTLRDKHTVLPETYLNWLTSHITNLIEIAANQSHLKQPFEKAEHQVLKELPDRLTKKTIRKFTRSNLHTLGKLLAPVFPEDESFHAVRKLLKGLLYTWPYLENNVSLISSYSTLSSEQSITSFTVLLGNFHDISSALHLLHANCFNDQFSENEREILRDIEKIWRKDNETAREKINTRLQKIISSKQSSPSGNDNSYQNLTLLE